MVVATAPLPARRGRTAGVRLGAVWVIVGPTYASRVPDNARRVAWEPAVYRLIWHPPPERTFRLGRVFHMV
ncbi:hypothetical protein TPA0907_50070 [Micromonospora humidisoli]|nr:hypothetical protein TPA0907_50070 [Micromonospora sp. AKA109]